MKKVVRIVRVWKFRLIKNALPFPAIYWATALAIKRSSSCVACQNEEKKIYLSFKWRRLFTTGVLPYRDKLTKFWLLTVSRTNDSAENRDGKNKTRSVFWYSKEGKGARRAKRWATKLNFVFSIFFSFIFAIFFFFKYTNRRYLWYAHRGKKYHVPFLGSCWLVPAKYRLWKFFTAKNDRQWADSVIAGIHRH